MSNQYSLGYNIREMNLMKAVAFAPGHISGFFAPKFDKDFLKTGSRGAGINISLGAKSEVIVNNSKDIQHCVGVLLNNEKERIRLGKKAKDFLKKWDKILTPT